MMANGLYMMHYYAAGLILYFETIVARGVVIKASPHREHERRVEQFFQNQESLLLTCQHCL
jgi:hypothetical protein